MKDKMVARAFGRQELWVTRPLPGNYYYFCSDNLQVVFPFQQLIFKSLTSRFSVVLCIIFIITPGRGSICEIRSFSCYHHYHYYHYYYYYYYYYYYKKRKYWISSVFDIVSRQPCPTFMNKVLFRSCLLIIIRKVIPESVSVSVQGRIQDF